MSAMTLPSSVLRDLLAGALVCAARDETTPVLECVRLTWGAGRIAVDSTDRYRMIEGAATPLSEDGEAVLLIDRRDVDALVKFLPKPPKVGKIPDALVTLEAGRIAVEVDGSTKVAPLGFLDFPKVESLWPKGEPVAVERITHTPAFVAGMVKVPLAKDGLWHWTFYGERKPTLVEADGPGGIAWRWLTMPAKDVRTQR